MLGCGCKTHYEQFLATDNTKDTIFVSVASYRDKNCPLTLQSMFSNAAHPENIFVGLCQQNMDSDIDCQINDQVPEQYRSQIRSMRVPHYDAQGPTWARYLCSTLLQTEKYYMQIDSHCLFSKDWDVKLVKMIKDLKQAGVKKPLLSHYTKSDEFYAGDQAQTEKSDTKVVPTICKCFFHEDVNMISFPGAEDVSFNPEELPLPNAYAAAGMMFGESEYVKEVPYDPKLPYLFVGEEILHSIRLWTHGWDIFTPTENVVYHYYSRAEEPKIWTDKSYSDSDALNKVRKLLDLPDAVDIAPYLQTNLDKYGLGSKRSLQQYLEYTQIKKDQKQVDRNFCHDKKEDIWNNYRQFQVRE